MNEALSILANIAVIGGVLFAIYQWRSDHRTEQSRRDREWDSDLLVRVSEELDHFALADRSTDAAALSLIRRNA